MQFDLFSLYRLMLQSRLFEEAVIQIWNDGKISGEMHLGIGEEAIVAGVVGQMQEDDAMALDHRGTPPLLMRGVDPVLLLKEYLGQRDGLCSGMGGHMHLFSLEHLAASSGIVGASGPSAVGFAFAAKHLRSGTLSVAFFGEGAMNQGMMLESLNLAVVWKLPLLFICKDNKWAITTRSSSVTGGNLVDRARGFGMPSLKVDGSDVEVVWDAASKAMERARNGGGPTFLHAYCTRPEGHFLGDPLLRIARHPTTELKQMVGPLLKSVSKGKGAPLSKRAASLGTVTSLIGKITINENWKRSDPLERTRKKLKSEKARLKKLTEEENQKIRKAVETALIPSDIGPKRNSA